LPLKGEGKVSMVVTLVTGERPGNQFRMH
jgi:hypothetical protein